jgi:hypothetical protein
MLIEFGRKGTKKYSNNVYYCVYFYKKYYCCLLYCAFCVVLLLFLPKYSYFCGVHLFYVQKKCEFVLYININKDCVWAFLIRSVL